MPRFARIHVAGGLFHVICRFHDRRFYLDVEGAREKYLEHLGKAAGMHDCRVVAYCLMSSHVHLVLQLGNDPLGDLTKAVNSPFCPDWLATEAVFGSDVKEHESIRQELASFVDEGRREPRRPEFSGEVSRALAKRDRKCLWPKG